jgi:two-component system, cell cycle response regulator DivK
MNAVIFCIEDNQDCMLILKRAVHAMGHRFISTLTGVDALNRAIELRPDIIILEMNLPDSDAYQIARSLRSCDDRRLRYMPIIAITTNFRRGDAEKAIEAGCDVCISKPIQDHELWLRIEGLLEIIRQ